MYMSIFLALSIFFSLFSYLLTPFQSLFLLGVSGLVLIYLLIDWNAKKKMKLSMSVVLFFALVIVISQMFLDINLLFVYYNIWTMGTSITMILIYRLLNKEKKIETVEAEVIVEKRGTSAPVFNTNSSHVFDGDFIEETEEYLWGNTREMITHKKNYEKHELEFKNILGLEISNDTMSNMLYQLRDEVVRKEKEIENLLKNLENVYLSMINYKNEKLKLSEDFESVKAEEEYYLEQAILTEEKYQEEKIKAEEALEMAKISKEEALKFKNKNIELRNMIDEKNRSNIEKIGNKRKELKKRWEILFRDFKIISRVYKNISKFPNKDVLYIEMALHKLLLAEDPKALSRGLYVGTKGDLKYEHMGVEQTDVPYRIVYNIVNRGKIRIEIDDIFKHNEKKFN